MSDGSFADELTKRVYDRAGFGGMVKAGQVPAVLVVDFSYGFTDPASPLGSDMAAAVSGARRVLDAAREAGVLAVFTSIAYVTGAIDGGAWLRKVPSLGQLTAGSRWVEIDDRLGRRDGEPVLYKRGASAFFGTPLVSILLSHGVDTLLVAGATTSGCVRASVVDSVQYGFDTLVVRDCVADRARGPHDANLFDMEAKYASLVGSDEAIEYLQRGKASVGTRSGG